MAILSLALVHAPTLSLPQLAAAVCSALVIYVVVGRWQHARTRAKNHCEEPPHYSHKDPILGLDALRRQTKARKENRSLPLGQQMFKEHGNTFQVTQLGKQVIHTIEPENLRVIFCAKASDWGIEPLRLPYMGDFCGPGLTTTDGDAWHRSKKLFSPSFERKVISDFSVLEKHLQGMMGKIHTGATIDMHSEISMMFTHYTMSFLFGGSVDKLSETEFDEVYGAFIQAIYGSGIRIMLGPLRWLGRTSKWLTACKRTHEFADAYVNKALEYRSDLKQDAVTPKRRRNVLLHNLAQQTGNRVTLRNEILNAFLVSQSTTAYLISNILFALSRSPETWSKIRAEALEAIGDHQCPTFDQLRHLRETRKVIDEALRLYPVLPTNKRSALKDTILPLGGGPSGTSPIFVPKGTTISMSYYALHRSPQIWGPDADIFDPDRWDRVDRSDRSPYEYIPFGVGPRSCIGREKALAEAAYVIVRLVQRFEGVESRDAREWAGYVGVTAHNANGCQVAFV